MSIRLTSEIDKLLYLALLNAYKNIDNDWTEIVQSYESDEEIVLTPQSDEEIVLTPSDEEIVLTKAL